MRKARRAVARGATTQNPTTSSTLPRFSGRLLAITAPQNAPTRTMLKDTGSLTSVRATVRTSETAIAMMTIWSVAVGVRLPARLFDMLEPSKITPRIRPADDTTSASLRVSAPEPRPFPMRNALLFHPKTKTRATPSSVAVSSAIALGDQDYEDVAGVHRVVSDVVRREDEIAQLYRGYRVESTWKF